MVRQDGGGEERVSAGRGGPGRSARPGRVRRAGPPRGRAGAGRLPPTPAAPAHANGHAAPPDGA